MFSKQDYWQRRKEGKRGQGDTPRSKLTMTLSTLNLGIKAFKRAHPGKTKLHREYKRYARRASGVEDA